MSFSDFLENELLDHAFKNTSYTPTATLRIALYTAAPSDAGGGTEVTGGSYARVSVTAATGMNTASGGSISNNGAITFPTATASWGTVTHFGIFESGDTNLLAWGALDASKTIGSGDTASFANAALAITLD